MNTRQNNPLRLWADAILVLTLSGLPLVSAFVFVFFGTEFGSTPLIANDALLLVSFFLCSIRLRDSLLVISDSGHYSNFAIFHIAISFLVQCFSLFMFGVAKFHDRLWYQLGWEPVGFRQAAGVVYGVSLIIFFLPYVSGVPDEVIQKATNVGAIIVAGIRHVLLFTLPAAVLTLISFKLFTYPWSFLNYVQAFGFWLALEIIFVEGIKKRKGGAA